jgi:tRNA 2-thiouridine synthesizing protein A
MSSDSLPFDEDWDAGDLGCGELVLLLRFRLKEMRAGQVIRVRATDAGAPHDIPAWCRMTGETLVGQDPGRGYYWIRRSGR